MVHILSGRVFPQETLMCPLHAGPDLCYAADILYSLSKKVVVVLKSEFQIASHCRGFRKLDEWRTVWLNVDIVKQAD